MTAAAGFQEYSRLLSVEVRLICQESILFKIKKQKTYVSPFTFIFHIVYADHILIYSVSRPAEPIAIEAAKGKEEDCMGGLKLAESILKAAAALIAAAMSIVRLIGSIGRMKSAEA